VANGDFVVTRNFNDERRAPENSQRSDDYIRNWIGRLPYRDTILGEAIDNHDNIYRMKVGSSPSTFAMVMWASKKKYDVHDPRTLTDAVKKLVPYAYLNQYHLSLAQANGYPRFNSELIRKVMAGETRHIDGLTQMDTLSRHVVSQTLIHEVN
jgi:hypothetical protein